MNTATLTTAGGLVFVGDWDRHFYALSRDHRKNPVADAAHRPAPQGFPMTYAVGGRQYVAVPAGGGGASWSTQIAADLRPDLRRPQGGNSLFVFALPSE